MRYDDYVCHQTMHSHHTNMAGALPCRLHKIRNGAFNFRSHFHTLNRIPNKEGNTFDEEKQN